MERQGAEEAVAVASPTVETSKTEVQKLVAEETPAPAAISNGETTAEDVTKTVPPKPAEEMKPEDVGAEKSANDAPAPIESPQEEAKSLVEEPKASEVLSLEEAAEVAAEPLTTEEVAKEVRSEEVPPPLPTSNPPSPVMAFAESTKADVLSNSVLPQTTESVPTEQPAATEKTVETLASLVVEAIPASTESSKMSKSQPETKIATPVEVAPPGKEKVLGKEVTKTDSAPVAAEQATETPAVTQTVDKTEDKPEPATKTDSSSTETVAASKNQPSPATEQIADIKVETKPVVASEPPKTEQVSESHNESALQSETPENPPEPPVTEAAPAASPKASKPESPIELKSELRSNSPIKETAEPTSLPPISDPVASPEPVGNADSLPDISTESLPSLPEPVSESLPPMSLPPVDSVPEPITADAPTTPSQTTDANAAPPKEAEITTPQAEAAVLTNGNAATNGLPSPPAVPVVEAAQTPAAVSDGPLKQVVSTPEVAPAAENGSEIRQADGDKQTKEKTPVAVEE